METLYHGSHETLTEIKDDEMGLFGGIFASYDEQVCLSHAPKLHKIELEESEILTQHDLDYTVDYDLVKSALIAALNFDDSELDDVYEIVIADKSAHKSDLDEARILEIFGSDDLGSASWEAQRIRGVIAKKLGYKAIEMRDEHGTTYLVLPSAKIKYID